MIRIKSDSIRSRIKALRCSQEVLLDGVIYTARDRAHQELVKAIKAGRRLPLSLQGQIIYYCGPTAVSKKGEIGACGPTTSSRMDEFAADLLKAGLAGMIGKGRRSPQVKAAIKRYRAVYFITYAGCGALLSTKVKKARLIAYRQFGPEAMYELTVKDFPLIVAIDSQGKDIFDM